MNWDIYDVIMVRKITFLFHSILNQNPVAHESGLKLRRVLLQSDRLAGSCEQKFPVGYGF